MLLIIIISSYLVLLIVSLFYRFRQPKDINSLYGYRTPLSMKSKENWFYANKLASSYMLFVTHAILFLSLIVYKLQILGYLSVNFCVILISMLIPLVCFISMIYIIETKLSKKNDKI